MTNSADPEQLATELDLRCLQRQGISGFSKTRVKRYFNKIKGIVVIKKVY